MCCRQPLISANLMLSSTCAASRCSKCPSTQACEDGREAAEVVEELKAETAKLQKEPCIVSVLGPELMAIAEDSKPKHANVSIVWA